MARLYKVYDRDRGVNVYLKNKRSAQLLRKRLRAARHNPKGLDPAAKVLIGTGVALAAMVGIILLVDSKSSAAAAATPTPLPSSPSNPPLTPPFQPPIALPLPNLSTGHAYNLVIAASNLNIAVDQLSRFGFSNVGNPMCGPFLPPAPQICNINGVVWTGANDVQPPDLGAVTYLSIIDLGV